MREASGEVRSRGQPSENDANLSFLARFFKN